MDRVTAIEKQIKFPTEEEMQKHSQQLRHLLKRLNKIQKKVVVNKVVSSLLAIQVPTITVTYSDLSDKEKSLIRKNLNEIFQNSEQDDIMSDADDPTALCKALRALYADVQCEFQLVEANKEKTNESDIKDKIPEREIKEELERKFEYCKILTRGLSNLYELFQIDLIHGMYENAEILWLFLRIFGTMEVLSQIENRVRELLRLSFYHITTKLKRKSNTTDQTALPTLKRLSECKLQI